jgi:hypothetical protein
MFEVVRSYHPVAPEIVGDPEPPVLLVPVNDPPAMIAVPVPPVTVSVPQAVQRLVMAVFWSFTEPPVRLQDSVTRPPALKKYLAELALANVTVCVNVTLVTHDVVLSVLVVVVLPLAAQFNLLLNTDVMLVDNAANADMVLPATGDVIADIEVPWWLAALEILANNVDHCVAVITDPALTGDTVLDWP